MQTMIKQSNGGSGFSRDDEYMCTSIRRPAPPHDMTSNPYWVKTPADALDGNMEDGIAITVVDFVGFPIGRDTGKAIF
jgi:hypothetical protein